LFSHTLNHGLFVEKKILPIKKNWKKIEDTRLSSLLHTLNLNRQANSESKNLPDKHLTLPMFSEFTRTIPSSTSAYVNLPRQMQNGCALKLEQIPNRTVVPSKATTSIDVDKVRDAHQKQTSSASFIDIEDPNVVPR
jgi:hypothetical protein